MPSTATMHRFEGRFNEKGWWLSSRSKDGH
jgi:hypothetical protein